MDGYSVVIYLFGNLQTEFFIEQLEGLPSTHLNTKNFERYQVVSPTVDLDYILFIFYTGACNDLM